jgi:hypothetical protein
MTDWPSPDYTKRPEDQRYTEPPIPYLLADQASYHAVILTINQLIDLVNALALKEALK